MYATIQRWGNSQGIRIPKALLEALNIRENDRVELVPAKDSITIKKAAVSAHKTLEERLTTFYGRPIDEITRIESDQEVEWGKAEGREAW
ncbi:MAG: AbrB/MazE/SpoVT family DNA-binding domain-containing protein [Oscillospiraceae bacterium]|nr:AbrB/MazE/SpoVT family DNA-binding domain-containing protein [Oscillospiraceae bacterium]MDE7171838.1 AbrB/MazE/SpoVT family DNA-binding domain-containing protein [Oscillospiraceae bacterium]